MKKPFNQPSLLTTVKDPPNLLWIRAQGPCHNCGLKGDYFFAQTRVGPQGKGGLQTLCNKCWCVLLELMMRSYMRIQKDEREGKGEGILPYPIKREK